MSVWYGMLSHLMTVIMRDLEAIVNGHTDPLRDNAAAIALGSKLIDHKSALVESLVRRFLRRDEPWDDNVGFHFELLTCLANTMSLILNMIFDANNADALVKAVGITLAELLQEQYDKLHRSMMDHLAGSSDDDDEDDEDDDDGGDHDGEGDAKRRRKN
jgi:hypothetical protein